MTDRAQSAWAYEFWIHPQLLADPPALDSCMTMNIVTARELASYDGVVLDDNPSQIHVEPLWYVPGPGDEPGMWVGEPQAQFLHGFDPDAPSILHVGVRWPPRTVAP